jgi:ornithine carbamoyltransferase
VKVRHYLEVDDLTPDELREVLSAASISSGVPLAGLGVAMIFEKPSLRTRNSTEMAVVQLGGHPVFITDAESAIDIRESAEDIQRVLQGYYSIVCARVFAHSKLERMAGIAKVPVVNLLSDDAHPVQALADLLTINSEFRSVQGRKVVWLGDFSNVARSLTIGVLMLGGHVVFCGPNRYGPAEADIKRFADLAERFTGSFSQTTDPVPAMSDADVLSTDAWYSMGQEEEAAERRPVMEPFRIDEALLGAAPSHAIVLHCLPAHRGEEITAGVLEGSQSRVFQQAENRMHSIRGLFRWLSA